MKKSVRGEEEEEESLSYFYSIFHGKNKEKKKRERLTECAADRLVISRQHESHPLLLSD